MAEPGTPVVFIHGLWLHATSWTPWVDHFRAAGYAPVAPGWPHEPETVESTSGLEPAAGRPAPQWQPNRPRFGQLHRSWTNGELPAVASTTAFSGRPWWPRPSGRR